jgi:hypothetical protein
MDRTRLSLFYVAGYLLPTGLGLMVAPGTVLPLLMSNGSYGDTMPRFVGCLMVALGMLVVATIRARAAGLYPATLAVRGFIWLFCLWLFARSGDPLFAMILAVMAVGMLFTGYCYWSESRSRQ